MPKTVKLPTTLAEFAADPADLLDRLTEPGRAVRLAVGDAAVVVMSVENFRRMSKEADLGAVVEGMDDVKAGRMRPAEEVFAELAAKYNLPPAG